MFDKAVMLYRASKVRYENDHGSITIGKIIAIVLACIVIAYVLPVGLTALAAMNTTGMSDAEVALLSILGLLFVLVIFAAVAKEAE